MFQDDPLGRRFSRVLLPRGVSVGRSVHKRKATFWATLKGHRRRETALPLAKNTSVATQQGRSRHTTILAYLRDLRAAGKAAGKSFD
jgi:hypothetical protein